MSLDPQARNLLDLVAASGRPPWEQLPVAEARADYLGRRHVVQPPPPDVARVDELTIASGRHELAARHYRPVGTADADVLPALVYFHGGGWTIGDLDTHDTLCRELANAVGLRGGRRSTTAWAPSTASRPRSTTPRRHALGRAQPPRSASMPARLAVGGDSAGGNLAAVVALRAARRRRSADRLPVADLSGHRHALRPRPRIAATATATCSRADTSRTSATTTSPTRARPRLARLAAAARATCRACRRRWCSPPASTRCATKAWHYAERWSPPAIASTDVCFERQIHGFITMGRMIDEAGVAIERCSRALRQAFSGRR